MLCFVVCFKEVSLSNLCFFCDGDGGDGEGDDGDCVGEGGGDG